MKTKEDIEEIVKCADIGEKGATELAECLENL